MSEQRPNPEKLLQRVQQEERQADRGKLKIYLGAAPGVGKTYMMLQDAISKRAQGLDVIVGVVESHGRKEIEALLSKIDILPPQQVAYRGKELLEFDLDSALKRNPGLILIDEMAHTNAPGLRHNKRWQDIKEILDRGIDVYTTLNVQHIESLNDIVSQIIHAKVKETVPDSMLEVAETIELIDLPPEDLLKRLQEGKVYFPRQAELAVEHFFQKGNLIALRELALRATAERVGAQVLLYRQGQGIKHVWPTSEKIVVCVGPGAEATKLIRAARRMATNLQAPWIAVHVDAARMHQSEDVRNSAIQNLRLAEQLGAETEILTGFSVVNEIMNFAREQNITKLVVGKPIKPRWKDILLGSFADQLVRQSGEIDVYIISGKETTSTKPPKSLPQPRTIPWIIYGLALLVPSIATGVCYLLSPYLDIGSLMMIYLLGIIIVTLCGRLGPSIVVTLLSTIASAFYFVPAFYIFDYSDIQYLFTLGIMLLTAILISHLTILVRRQAKFSRLAGQRSATLHSLSRQLAATRGVDKLLLTAIRYISEVFNSDTVVLLPENGHLQIRSTYKGGAALNAKEQGVAQWVFDLGQIAGLGTDTLPFSDSIYIPLLTSQGAIGVLRVRPLQATRLFTPEQMHLLEASANQIALAIEVDRLQEQTKKNELQSATDKVRNALLQSVSHDLRAPLIAVMGAGSTLMEKGEELSPSTIKKLGNEIYAESEQVSRLINNLLQMTYLEAEEIKLEKQSYPINDEVNLVLKTLDKQLGKKPVNINIDSHLPQIPFDRVLIGEVLTSLIDNTIKFTSPPAPITISAVMDAGRIVISVEDRGPGIEPDEVSKLFDKFYRGRRLTTERGLGLGLAICKRIVNAHGGEIWAENLKEGGAAFRFSLPLQTSS